MRAHRRGVTLIEVLTAIFIMGVGLLAILTLFPLGALSMARAVRDDRAATAGSNAGSFANAMDLRNDPFVVNALLAPPPAGFAAPDPDSPSYPVLVDPLYVQLKAGHSQGTITERYIHAAQVLFPRAAAKGESRLFRDLAETGPVENPGRKRVPEWLTR